MKEENDKYHEYLNGNEIAGSEIQADLKEFLDNVENIKPVKFTKSKGEMWDTIASEIEDENNNTKVKNFGWLKIMGVAAAFLLLIISGISFSNLRKKEINAVSHITSSQEQKGFSLPDGSKVYLNAVSSLGYGDDWDRKVNLEGEAFFEVTKGEKFSISTNMGEVQVLGTSFNVSARKDVFAVNCKTGKVKVSFKNSSEKPVYLVKGQGVIFDNGMIVKSNLNPTLIGNWQIGEYHFTDRPLIEVLAELERQYDVDIRLEDKSQAMRPYNGYFIKEDLAVALSMVCDPMGLAFDIKEGVVSIKTN